MIRAVLDANVFISGILNAQGAPGQVLDAWRAEQFLLLISPPILEELERVLYYPKIATRHGWSQAMVQQFLFRLTTIATTTPGDLVLSVVDDPSDNRYLECAVEGNATHLVSGDRDLLGLGHFEGIAIVAPQVFLDVLTTQ
jgi:hypothetical protein